MTTVTINQIKERLALIQSEIDGIKRAYAYGPVSLPPSDLPLFVNFTGPATDDWRSMGADYDVETRMFLMRLYVSPVGAGIDGEQERKATAFIEPVLRTFSARPGLGTGQVDTQLAWVREALYLGDGGFGVMTYNGDEFSGVEFRLQVSRQIDRDYDDGE